MSSPVNAKGKTILITGSTDGVGRHVARRLAAAGAHVIVHGRSRERGRAVVDAIRADGAGSATFHAADFSSLASVRALAGAVRADHARLDVLINNAGIGTGPDRGRREIGADGHELRFTVNYLAGFLLTRLLLPTLGAGTRIVNVSSAGQQAIDFEDPMLLRGYDGVRAYCQSKLAQILFTFDLARELEGTGITASCLHPASFMDTTMVRQSGTRPMSTVEEGGDAILHLALSPDLDGRSGLYLDGRRPARAAAQAYDERARERLRALSLRLTGLDHGA